MTKSSKCLLFFFFFASNTALGHQSISIPSHSPSCSRFLSKVLFIFPSLRSFNEKSLSILMRVTFVYTFKAKKKPKTKQREQTGFTLRCYLIMKHSTLFEHLSPQLINGMCVCVWKFVFFLFFSFRDKVHQIQPW